MVFVAMSFGSNGVVLVQDAVEQWCLDEGLPGLKGGHLRQTKSRRKTTAVGFCSPGQPSLRKTTPKGSRACLPLGKT